MLNNNLFSCVGTIYFEWSWFRSLFTQALQVIDIGCVGGSGN